MQENSYLILGLKDNATLQEVENAYKNLKEKYQIQCFEEGETGSLGAKMLSKIKIAYNDCIEDIKKREIIGDGSIYQAIKKLINEGKLNEAQQLLDNTEPRDGEWHYTQANIFYRRNWFLESKVQVEMALALDPNNSDYLNTLDILKRQQFKADDELKAARQSRAGYEQPKEVSGGSMTGGLCSYCASCLLCNAICYFCI
ncbi:MAG: hypothetical protein K2I23_01280 [Clostridia bacterium]|nr:hypothetical protein [Clostridia bacterium]